MYIGMTASICSLIYTCLLLVVYFKKIKLRNDENMVYGAMLMSNTLGLILEFFIYLFAVLPNIENEIIPMIIERFYFMYLFSWIFLFVNYMYITSYEELTAEYNIVKNKKYLLTMGAIYIVISALILFLPVKHIIDGTSTYSIGPACNVLYGSAIISIILSIIFVFDSRKKINYKKKLPLIFLIFCLIIILAVRSIIPEVLFLSTAISFITILTFFTIENPDIKTLKELNYSKKIAEKSKIATLETLNELQKDLKGTCDKLINFGYKKIDENNLDEIYNEIKYIKKNSIDLVDKISIAIDFAKIDSGNYIINRNEYDTYELIDNIKYYLNYKRGNKKISIKTDVSDNISKVLYGDSEKITQIVIYIFGYLIKLTNDSLIHIQIDSRKVRNLCRLKFHFNINCNDIDKYIDFSGKHSINTDDDNILDFEIIQKLLELLRGKIELRNNNKAETSEIILSIDQLIVPEYDIDNENINNNKKKTIKYFNAKDKKVLIIDDDKFKIKKMIELLKPYNLNINTLNNISDLKDVEFEKGKYDLIFIDDIIPLDLKNNTSNEKSVDKTNKIIKLNKRFSSYSIPTVVMITKNNEDIENKCLISGFNDYIIKPINKFDLNEILIKYLKR